MTTIIKKHGAAGEDDAVRCAAFNLDDIAEHAQEYLAEVRRRAEAIVQQARDEADRLRRQAVEQGRSEALKTAQQQATAKAREELEQRLKSLEPALTAAAAQIEQSRAAWRRHWEERAVQLAVAIAERVVRRETERTPEIALTLVQESLDLAAGAGRIVLRLSPRDYDTLKDQVQAIVAKMGRRLPTEIVADETVAPGGCLVVTELGEIDQRLQSQLARIEEELIG
jgi:flagellar assembly protein FliH